MRVLLIGGTGVLSSDVMRLSVEKGHDVFVLNRGTNIKSILPGVSLIKVDIKRTGEVSSILKDLYFDVVVDFISYTVSDLKNSLSLFQSRCQQFIFISSACVYRRAKSDGCITENSPLGNPNWDYSIDKMHCEEYLISKCSQKGLTYTIVRPYITYGNTRIPYGIMPAYGWHWTFIGRLLRNKPIMMWDEGEAVCTLTHTSDFAKGLVGLFGNIKAHNEAFHIVSDEIITWKELLALIGDIVGRQPTVVAIPSDYIAIKLPYLKGMLLGDRSLDAVFDNAKIKDAVPEFICTTLLRKGIVQTLEHYKDNGYINGIDYKWDAQMDKLIHEYLKENDSGILKGLNLGYTNYLQGSLIDRSRYYFYRYSPLILVKICKITKHIFRRLKG